MPSSGYMDVPAIPIPLGITLTDREPIVQHVRSAIDLVAAGGAQRVTLIRFPGQRWLPRARSGC